MRPLDDLPSPSAEEILQLSRLDPFPSYLPSLYLPVFDAVVDLRLHAIEADWKITLESGWRCLGLAHAALRLHQDHASALRRALALQQLSDDFADALLEEAFSNEDQAELVSALQAGAGKINALAGVDGAMALVESDAEFAEIGDTFDELRAELMQIHQNAFNEANSLLNQGAAGALLGRMDEQRETVMKAIVEEDGMILAGLSRGLIAVAHAAFNLTNRSEGAIDAFVSSDHLGAADRTINRFEKRLRDLQMELYISCARSALEEVAWAGEHIVEDIERILPAFLRSQAVLRQAMEWLRSLGRNGDAELLGRRAARAGDLTREALGSHVAAARMIQEIASGFRSEAVSKVVGQAPGAAFDCKFPGGRNTRLNDLADRPEGELVEVEGFVDTLEVIQRPGRARVSRVGLLDPSSGATFPAVLLFAHLPHAGLTEGAYCRLHGRVQPSSDLNEGDPAVEIDRLALEELAEDNWRVAFLRLALPWYEVWRSEANMVWSVGPHRPQDDQDVIALGAADLVYPPLVGG